MLGKWEKKNTIAKIMEPRKVGIFFNNKVECDQ